MGIKDLVKAVTPSPIWEYLKHKKAQHRYRKAENMTLSVMRSYLRSTGLRGFKSFIILDELKNYTAAGKVFNGEQYYSQACQDYFLDEFIFHRKEGGFFLDIGGNNPVRINNTYFFEKNRGWSGLAFEPVAEQREQWKTARNTECLPFALGSVTGEVEFCEYEAQAMSGFSSEVEYTEMLRHDIKFLLDGLQIYLTNAE